MELVEYLGSGSVFYSFPLKRPALTLSSPNWTANRVVMTESATGSGLWSCLVDATISDTWLVFEGSTLPASYAVRKADWVKPASGSGENTIEIVVTSSSVPIRGAFVTIQLSGVAVSYGMTDVAGKVQFSLNDGSYTVNVSASGYDAIIGTALTVTTNASVPLSITQVSITPPGNIQLCTIQFIVRDASGPIAGCIVEATLDEKNSSTDGSLIAQTTTLETTNSSGIAELTLIRHDAFTAGGSYHITVTQPCGVVSFDKRVYVSNLSTVTADKLVAV